jgi:hypothetical protein
MSFKLNIGENVSESEPLVELPPFTVTVFVFLILLILHEHPTPPPLVHPELHPAVVLLQPQEVPQELGFEVASYGSVPALTSSISDIPSPSSSMSSELGFPSLSRSHVRALIDGLHESVGAISSLFK